MTLAERLGWTETKGYIPTAFTITAFAIGVQVKLVADALGPRSYPPAGQDALGWGTLAVLAASLILHVPWRRWPQARDKIAELAETTTTEPAADAEPAGGPAPGTPDRTNGHNEPPESMPRLKARVHSPIQHGPVFAPGDEVPVTIEAEPEELACDLEVTIETESPSGSQTAQPEMTGTQLEHVVSFGDPGRFSLTVKLDHPRSDPASKTFEGRVATYREEVGRIFEEAKERGSKAGLDIGPQSTPREVCRELGKLDGADAGDLADLAVELEIALYGDEEVDRASYETVYHAIEGLDLPSEDTREVAP